jgi:hypothetical protein
LPIFIESYTDLQTEYLRIARNFFGTWYIAENELLDKIGINQKAIEGFDKYLRILTRASISEIEMASNLQKCLLAIPCWP